VATSKPDNGMPNWQRTISVFIPALNEDRNLEPTVARLIEALAVTVEDYEIIIIDDGSSDATGAIADRLAAENSLIRVLHNPRNMGLGHCFVQSCREARKNFFVYIPGDNTWPYRSFVELLGNLGRADVVTSYSINPDVRPFSRRIVSRLYTEVVNLLFGRHLQYFNGLTIYPVEFLRRDPVTTFGFGFQAEVLLKALNSGLSYIEVALPIDARTAGGSKAVTLANILSVLATIVRLFFELRVMRRWRILHPRKPHRQQRLRARMLHKDSNTTGEVRANLLISLHQGLLKVRLTEELLAERYKQQEMRTPTHFGIGQEAVAVGVCSALRRDDVVYSHHRCHNHYLAKGGSVYKLAAELYGRAEGCSGGRGGSVHITAPEVGFIATSAILGETTACAVGSALAFKMDGSDRVAVTFFGEGAMDEGSFYESANYASVKRLPVLFVCENNLYATESPLQLRQPAGTDLCERMRSFKIDALRIDGNDVHEVYRAAGSALDSLRAGAGPFFLECTTYRWREHVGPYFDHERNRMYRTREEVEAWMERCPLKRSAERLTRLGIATPAQLDAWYQAVKTDVEGDIERAHNAPWPEVSTLFDHV
jgi:TPP-dependent pyruvate/acetoin dehydrogenase alpha subunit/glycosyltransferase involved in cell wall biosynthesis